MSATLPSNFVSFNDVLYQNALKYKNKIALSEIYPCNSKNLAITYSELQLKVKRLSSYLFTTFNKGQVLLVYSSCIDFIIAFLACLDVGLIPIPIEPINESNWEDKLENLKKLIEEFKIEAILSDAPICKIIKKNKHYFKYFKLTNIIDTSRYEHAEDSKKAFVCINKKVDVNSIAYIQRSSGTTGASKYIFLTHSNIIHSLINNSNHWNLTTEDISLIWTPCYLIYGLMTGILLPLFNGNTAYIISPADFIDNPIFWLASISTYRVTYSGCLLYGYQLCVNQAEKGKIKNIDLSNWRIAICGGEVIQEKILKAFKKTFAKWKFNENVFCPSYGMSEYTGFISSSNPGTKYNVYKLNKKTKTINKIGKSTMTKCVVSCGKIGQHSKILIIDREALTELPPGEMGEICLAGPSLFRNYSHKEKNLLKIGQQYYFRTGDLGFLFEDELYLMGRVDDLLKIGKKTYLMRKIEFYINSLSPLFRYQATVIVECANTNITVFQEISHEETKEQYIYLVHSIRKSVLHQLGILITNIVFVRSGTLPRTMNGKINRTHFKMAGFSNTLAVIYEDNNDLGQFLKHVYVS